MNCKSFNIRKEIIFLSSVYKSSTFLIASRTIKYSRVERKSIRCHFFLNVELLSIQSFRRTPKLPSNLYEAVVPYHIPLIVLQQSFLGQPHQKYD